MCSGDFNFCFTYNCHQVSSGNDKLHGFHYCRASQRFSTVSLQRKAFQVDFLKIICTGILFFPKPPEELASHKNALGNTGATMAHASKDVATPPQAADVCCFCASLILNVKMFIQIFLLGPCSIQVVN